eukprot:COSAG06_NODE_2179_length_7405_cov_69.786614_6_plen_124_part_00
MLLRAVSLLSLLVSGSFASRTSQAVGTGWQGGQGSVPRQQPADRNVSCARSSPTCSLGDETSSCQAAKYRYCRAAGARGVAMWEAGSLEYGSTPAGMRRTALMWATMHEFTQPQSNASYARHE